MGDDLPLPCHRKVAVLKEKTIQISELIKVCNELKDKHATSLEKEQKLIRNIKALSGHYIKCAAEKDKLDNDLDITRKERNELNKKLQNAQLRVEQLEQLITVYQVEREEYGREKIDRERERVKRLFRLFMQYRQIVKLGGSEPKWPFAILNEEFQLELQDWNKLCKKNKEAVASPLCSVPSTCAASPDSGFGSVTETMSSVEFNNDKSTAANHAGTILDSVENSRQELISDDENSSVSMGDETAKNETSSCGVESFANIFKRSMDVIAGESNDNDGKSRSSIDAEENHKGSFEADETIKNSINQKSIVDEANDVAEESCDSESQLRSFDPLPDLLSPIHSVKSHDTSFTTDISFTKVSDESASHIFTKDSVFDNQGSNEPGTDNIEISQDFSSIFSPLVSECVETSGAKNSDKIHIPTFENRSSINLTDSSQAISEKKSLEENKMIAPSIVSHDETISEQDVRMGRPNRTISVESFSRDNGSSNEDSTHAVGVKKSSQAKSVEPLSKNTKSSSEEAVCIKKSNVESFSNDTLSSSQEMPPKDNKNSIKSSTQDASIGAPKISVESFSNDIKISKDDSSLAVRVKKSNRSASVESLCSDNKILNVPDNIKNSIDAVGDETIPDNVISGIFKSFCSSLVLLSPIKDHHKKHCEVSTESAKTYQSKETVFGKDPKNSARMLKKNIWSSIDEASETKKTKDRAGFNKAMANFVEVKKNTERLSITTAESRAESLTGNIKSAFHVLTKESSCENKHSNQPNRIPTNIKDSVSAKHTVEKNHSSISANTEFSTQSAHLESVNRNVKCPPDPSQSSGLSSIKEHYKKCDEARNCEPLDTSSHSHSGSVSKSAKIVRKNVRPNIGDASETKMTIANGIEKSDAETLSEEIKNKFHQESSSGKCISDSTKDWIQFVSEKKTLEANKSYIEPNGVRSIPKSFESLFGSCDDIDSSNEVSSQTKRIRNRTITSESPVRDIKISNEAARMKRSNRTMSVESILNDTTSSNEGSIQAVRTRRHNRTTSLESPVKDIKNSKRPNRTISMESILNDTSSDEGSTNTVDMNKSNQISVESRLEDIKISNQGSTQSVRMRRSNRTISVESIANDTSSDEDSTHAGDMEKSNQIGMNSPLKDIKNFNNESTHDVFLRKSMRINECSNQAVRMRRPNRTISGETISNDTNEVPSKGVLVNELNCISGGTKDSIQSIREENTSSKVPNGFRSHSANIINKKIRARFNEAMTNFIEAKKVTDKLSTDLGTPVKTTDSKCAENVRGEVSRFDCKKSVNEVRRKSKEVIEGNTNNTLGSDSVEKRRKPETSLNSTLSTDLGIPVKTTRSDSKCAENVLDEVSRSDCKNSVNEVRRKSKEVIEGNTNNRLGSDSIEKRRKPETSLNSSLSTDLGIPVKTARSNSKCAENVLEEVSRSDCKNLKSVNEVRRKSKEVIQRNTNNTLGSDSVEKLRKPEASLNSTLSTDLGIPVKTPCSDSKCAEKVLGEVSRTDFKNSKSVNEVRRKSKEVIEESADDTIGSDPVEKRGKTETSLNSSSGNERLDVHRSSRTRIMPLKFSGSDWETNFGRKRNRVPIIDCQLRDDDANRPKKRKGNELLVEILSTMEKPPVIEKVPQTLIKGNKAKKEPEIVVAQETVLSSEKAFTPGKVVTARKAVSPSRGITPEKVVTPENVVAQADVPQSQLKNNESMDFVRTSRTRNVVLPLKLSGSEWETNFSPKRKRVALVDSPPKQIPIVQPEQVSHNSSSKFLSESCDISNLWDKLKSMKMKKSGVESAQSASYVDKPIMKELTDFYNPKEDLGLVDRSRKRKSSDLLEDILCTMENPPVIEKPHVLSEVPVSAKKKKKKKKKGKGQKGKKEPEKVVTLADVPERQLKSPERMMVAKVLDEFLLGTISSNEEGSARIKNCLTQLQSASDDAITRCIVSIVAENVEEALDMRFTPPAPPLTPTQHRLFVLFNCSPRIQALYKDMLARIRNMILPEKFLWPDDTLQSCSRFYAALCRQLDEPSTALRFCLDVAMGMKQRGAIVINAVLAAWPEILPFAESANIYGPGATLALLVMLTPMPTRTDQRQCMETLRNQLNRFYGYSRQVGAKEWSQNALAAVRNGDASAGFALMKIVKHLDPKWSSLAVVPPVLEALGVWQFAGLADSTAQSLLRILASAIARWPANDHKLMTVKNDAIQRIGEMLVSGKLSQQGEEHIVEEILSYIPNGQFATFLERWVPREAVTDSVASLIQATMTKLKVTRKQKKKKIKKKKKSNKTS